MTSPSIFDLGTVTLTNGSAEVTGDGTAWAVNGVAGGMFSCGGISVPIASVDDDTTLTLAYPWPGANASDVAYAISLLGSQAADTIWASRHWSRIVGQALLAGIHPAASGTLAERDALDPMLENGQWFAHAEPPYDLTFYRKVPGGWEGPYQFRGGTGSPGTNGVGDKFDLPIWLSGRPRAAEVFPRVVLAGAVTFPPSLSGSVALAGVAAADEAVFSLRKNDSEFATITFAASSDEGVFSSLGASFVAGDVLSLVAPSPRDDTLADISITISGSR